MSVRFGTALGLCLGAGLDRLWGDPSRGHPVAAFGTCAAALESRLYAPTRTAGGRHLAVCLLIVGGPAVALVRATAGGSLRRAAVVAAASWAVLGGRSLGRAADAVGDAVVAGDLPAARTGLPSLCGRDPEHLDASGLVRATVESVAENTSDAVVAPLVWGAVAGVPGLLLYRAVNTLDAMVGHRSARYRHFGTPAARLDDVANWLPARLSAGLAVLLAPLVGGDSSAALAAWRRDAAAHPSPNAGQVEAAFAGALGVRLGGLVVYPYGAEQRPVLGDGREVEAADVARAVRLSELVSGSALLVCAAGRGAGAARVTGASLLVAGTTSDAGKSILTAGLCRAFARRGLRVAPFKAQNMSLNSFVTLDGGEIGRAQAMQAAAAGVEPEAVMNPVLLKPGGERSSHVVVLGETTGSVSALSYRARKAGLADVVARSLAELRSRYDVVVCEGAGSPAEINLRSTDIANMGLARAADLPVLVVGDIDRGGVFASMFGTLALLDAADQALIAGFVVNKFRGDPALLEPGLDMLRGLTGRQVFGVLPWLPGLWLDVEDSLDLESDRGESAPPVGADVLRVSVVRLPRMSNATDVDALAAEPGVLVRFATRPEECADADLVVLPGSRATVEDLAWLRGRGLDRVLVARAAAGRPVLGICGGYQMLGRAIDDAVESGAGHVDGLGLLPLTVEFAGDRVLTRPVGRAGDLPVTGYEIHHGRITVDGGEPLVATDDGPEGCRVGATWGTVWHGLLENDAYRRRFLVDVAEAAGRDFVAGTVEFAAVRQARLDALGDLVESSLDVDAVLDLARSGAPADLPFVPPGAPALESPA